MNAYNNLSFNLNEDQTFQCPGGVFIYYLIFLVFYLYDCMYNNLHILYTHLFS